MLFNVFLQRIGTEEDVKAAQILADSTGGLPLALFNVAGEVYKIYHEIFPVGYFERGNILCNLGNLNLSLGNPEAALEYHLEAQTSFKIGQSADAEAGDQVVISPGRTRCYIDLGRLKEARENANFSIAILTERGYKLSLAHSIRLLGDIEFAEGDLIAAKQCYERSKSVMLGEMGGRAHQMVGAAYIRLGCLEQITGDHAKAVYVESMARSSSSCAFDLHILTDGSWFRDALKLADFNTFCRGYRARCLYMLSRALRAMPEPCPQKLRAGGDATMHEAKTLLRQILGDRFREELCDMETTWDNLVCAHVR
ncbi:hypothetical protein F5B18DRAFT_121629 [Nemania serpens]|nr:hypothetical protein F5B18DRAFT_121629 [Nemania serpens]